jgi:hypothetical protein
MLMEDMTYATVVAFLGLLTGLRAVTRDVTSRATVLESG